MNDQQRPPVADDVQRLCDIAGQVVSRFHKNPSRVVGFILP